MEERFLLRERKFNPQNLFLSVLNLAVSTNQDGYFSALHKTWQGSGLTLESTPAKSSLSKYRSKVSANFFKDIFEKDLARLARERLMFKGFYVYGIDGDQLDLPTSKDILDNGYRGYQFRSDKETYYPRMYTVQAVDLLSGMVKEFYQSNVLSEVRLAREMVGRLEKNSITIYDRLHAKYHSVRAHSEAGNHFVIRVMTKNPRANLEIQKFCKSKKRSTVILLDPKNAERNLYPPIEVRLVRVRNPRSREKLVLMTSLSREQFSDKAIARLYQRRWEIELSFRDLTSTLKMNQWHSTKLNGILQEIYALLWLVNQVRFRLSLPDDKSKWLETEYVKSNFKLSMKVTIDHLNLLIEQKVNEFNQIFDFWALRSREGRRHLARSYPRQVRSFAKRYKNAGTVRRRRPPLRGEAA